MEQEKKQPDVSEHGESPFDGIHEDIFPASDGGKPPRARSGLSLLVVGLLSAGALTAIAAFLGLRWWEHLRPIAIDDAVVRGEIVTLSSKLQGKIASIEVREGDSVTAGQIVARLEDEGFQAEANKARGDFQSAENRLRKAETGLESLRRRVPVEWNEASRALENSRSRLKAAESRRRHTRTESSGAQKVYRAGPGYVLKKREVEWSRARTGAEVEAARKEVKRSESRLQTAKAKKHLLESKERLTKAAKARLDRAQSALDAAMSRVAASAVSSPINGIVARRGFGEGDVVAAGDTIATVVDVDRLWIEAYLDEAKAKSVNVGRAVEAKVEADPEVKIEGRVVQIGSGSAPQTDSPPSAQGPGQAPKAGQGVPVKIELPQPADKLRPGMKASVVIERRGS